MTPRRKKRLYLVSLIVIGVGIAAALGLNAFNENIMFFHAPTAVVQGEAPKDHVFRLGGLGLTQNGHRGDQFVHVQAVD